jgi:antitoxin FitA
MTTSLLVRNLEPHIKAALKARAIAHHCSLEEEVRVILRAAAAQQGSPEQYGLGTRIHQLMLQSGGGFDLELPSRHGPEREPPTFD